MGLKLLPVPGHLPPVLLPMLLLFVWLLQASPAAAEVHLHLSDGSVLSFQNVDIPYLPASKVHYPFPLTSASGLGNPAAIVPFVALNMTWPCTLTPSSAAAAAAAAAAVNGTAIVVHINFHNAVLNGADCTCYADVLRGIAGLNLTRTVVLISQSDYAVFIPGYIDFYGPDPVAFYASGTAATAVTIVSYADGLVLDMLTSGTVTGVSVSQVASPWLQLLTNPAFTAYRVVQSVVSGAAIIFLLARQVMTVLAWHRARTVTAQGSHSGYISSARESRCGGCFTVRVPLGTQIQLCLLGMFLVRLVEAAVDASDLDLRLGPFGITAALVFGSFTLLVVSFGLLLQGWARAVAYTTLGSGRMQPVLRAVRRYVVRVLVVGFTAAWAVIVAFAYDGRVRTPLSGAYTAALYVLGIVFMLLLLCVLVLGSMLLHLRLQDPSSGRLVKITVLLIMATLAFVGLSIDGVFSSSIETSAPDTVIFFCWIESLLTSTAGIAVLAILRYDSIANIVTSESDRHETPLHVGHGQGPSRAATASSLSSSASLSGPGKLPVPVAADRDTVVVMVDGSPHWHWTGPPTGTQAGTPTGKLYPATPSTTASGTTATTATTIDSPSGRLSVILDDEEAAAAGANLNNNSNSPSISSSLGGGGLSGRESLVLLPLTPVTPQVVLAPPPASTNAENNPQPAESPSSPARPSGHTRRGHGGIYWT